MGGKAMRRDLREQAIQAFVSDPAKVQVPVTLGAGESITFGPGATFDYNITGWLAVQFYTTGNLTRWFNEDTTKTRTLLNYQESVLVFDEAIEKLTVKNNGAADVTLEIEGM
jgi:hypothetical protein